MKKLALTLSCLFAVSSLFAQKIELSVQANSTIFHYSGSSAKASTFINATPPSYSNNPYGTKSAAGYGADFQAQYIARNRFIVGVQAGYDVLRSKIDIIGATPPYSTDIQTQTIVASSIMIPAKGQTYLTSRSVNFNPYIGYRLNLKQVTLDLMPGFDIGVNLSMHEKGTATATDGSGATYNIDNKREDAPTDIRVKFGAAALYKKFGITASYAHGLTNYGSKLIGAGFEARSELIRLGLSYRIL